MMYTLEFKHYERDFIKPLRTAYGVVSSRAGVIVRITDEGGKRGYGEVAPWEAFGTESVEEAIKILKSQEKFDANKFPATAYALECAHEDLKATYVQTASMPNVQLVSGVGELKKAVSLGVKTFIKCKIGVDDLETEISELKKILENVGDLVKLRLDANGGLDEQSTRTWLEALEESNSIDFIEQPLPKGKEKLMAKLQKEYNVKIALDESATTVQDIDNLLEERWEGKIIVKPSIMGSVKKFREFKKQATNQFIYSSIFETAIGVGHCVRLAQEDNALSVGLGTLEYFQNDGFSPDCSIENGVLNLKFPTQADKERIWSQAKEIS